MEARTGLNAAAHYSTAEQSTWSSALWIRLGQLATRFPTRGCGYCFEANCRCPISFLLNRRLCASKVRVCSNEGCTYSEVGIYEGKWDSDAVICSGLRTR